jgi:hypothetical protein
MWVIRMQRPSGVYYAVVESFRDGSGRPRRRTIAPLGKFATCFAKADDLRSQAYWERKPGTRDTPEDRAARSERAHGLERRAFWYEEVGRQVLRDENRARERSPW